MKRILKIDLVKDTELDLTLDELEALRDVVNFSIKQKKKQAKKPGATTLFDEPQLNPNATTIFVNSTVNDPSVFTAALKNESGMGVDIEFYYNSVKDWSEMNRGKKRTAKGWIATARTFMRSDNDKKKLKMVVTPGEKNHDADMLDYLKT